MLQKVVEDYLESIKEVQFFAPFSYLLQLMGYYDVHITHGSVEFGKDIIAKREEICGEVQYVFQVKAGDIDGAKYKNEVRPQLEQALTNSISHSNFDNDIPRQVVLVTTGVLKMHPAIDLQQYNINFVRKFFHNPILVIDRLGLIDYFVAYGIEPFFCTHSNPQFIGEFFQMYSKVKNMSSISFLDIVHYSQRWLDLGQSGIDRMQVFFESYMFSSLLLQCDRFYESAQFIAALVRYLLKYDLYGGYEQVIHSYLKHVADCLVCHIDSEYRNFGALYKSDKLYGIMKIFSYPVYCFQILELLSICILISEDAEDDHVRCLCRIVDDERGWERPLSDNYAASIALVSFVFIKLNKINYLNKFLNNIAIWVCDRYECLGLLNLGSSEERECEHLLSEYLLGLDGKKVYTSYIASVLLDVAYLSEDLNLYDNISNELRSSSINAEFYHVLRDDDLYDYENVSMSNDSEFSTKYAHDYSSYICFERSHSSVSVRSRGLFYMIFLLRDRIFPTFIRDLLRT